MPFHFVAILAAFLVLAQSAAAQTNAPASDAPKPKPATAPKLTKTQMTAAQLQKAVDTLTQSNRDLLDLLQKQQAVLEDMQFDRRLQSRQIASLEERLQSTLIENNQLQNKVNKFESQASLGSQPAPVSKPGDNPAPQPKAPVPSIEPVPAPPPPPSSHLPPPPANDGPPDLASWHRVLTLKGDDLKQTDLFQIRGKLWRVHWYNLDKPGKAFANTSALFISAFPKDDTIPQKVCAKLGTGGDSTELQGPGNYYLKIEASGGSWELAVDDFR